MISIDYQDKRPLYEQVVEKMEQLIVRGILPQDEKLPSVRTLAIELSINPNTIQRAYTVLEHDGFIYTIKGRGNFVAEKKAWIDEEKADMIASLKENLVKAKTLGVTENEIKSIISEVYEEENND